MCLFFSWPIVLVNLAKLQVCVPGCWFGSRKGFCCCWFTSKTLCNVSAVKLQGNSQKGFGEMSSQLFVTLFTLSIYQSAHKQLKRNLPNPFREFSCIGMDILVLLPFTFTFSLATGLFFKVYRTILHHLLK